MDIIELSGDNALFLVVNSGFQVNKLQFCKMITMLGYYIIYQRDFCLKILILTKLSKFYCVNFFIQ